jgi:hypothetical protein
MGIFAIAALAFVLPFALVRDLFRLGRGVARMAQRSGNNNVPLPQKNKTRATAGAFLLVGCAILAAHGFPVIGWQATAIIAAFALLYLVVGIHGAQGASFDFMSAFWWGVLALGSAVLLGFVKLNGFPL